MSKKKKKTLTVPRQPRNKVALNPLLRKSGVHQKTFKALRTKEKQTLRAQTRKSFRYIKVLLLGAICS